MFNHQIRTSKVRLAWGSLWVVHRIGHIPQQGDFFAEFDHLPDGKGPAQDTHVQMHATQDHMVDLMLTKQVPGFLAVVGDRVLIRNFNERILPGPR